VKEFETKYHSRGALKGLLFGSIVGFVGVNTYSIATEKTGQDRGLSVVGSVFFVLQAVL
jgi:hypothetical protein